MVLRSRLVLKLILKSDASPLLHVGSGTTLGTEVLQVLKVRNTEGKYVYLIPSHSIKGILRRISELVAKAVAIKSSNNSLEYLLMRSHCEIEGEGIRHVCGSNDDLRVINDYVLNILSNEVEATKYIPRESLEEVIRNFKERGLISTREVEPILASKCPICRLYGGPGIGGRVYILDIVIKEATSHFVMRTSIERVSGRVREAALFTVETVVVPKIELNITIENIELGSTEAKIIAGTLEWLSKVGISIGGMKSVGLGHYILEAQESRGTLIDYTSKVKSKYEILKTLIRPIEYLERQGKDIKELIKELRVR